MFSFVYNPMMKKPVRKILLINVHSVQNAGDAALLEMALRVLSVFDDVKIVIATNEPIPGLYLNGFDNIRVVLSFTGLFVKWRSDRRAYWRIDKMIWGVGISLIACLWYRLVGRLPPWLPPSWRDLLSAYAEADIVVSCPGNIFVTIGRLGMPFLVSGYSIAYALMMDKPLYILPQSIGPLKRWWERKLVGYLYSKARLVFVRDSISFRLAQEIGLENSRLRLVPDLAWAYPHASLEEAVHLLAKWVKGWEKPLLGVTVINRLIRSVENHVWDQYERSVAYALSCFLEKHGGTVIFFPQVTGPTEREDDRIAAYRIVSHMTISNRAIIINETLHPRILKAVYGLMDAFIATRMHSAIFAISMKVPTLMIGYLDKMRGLAELLSLEDWFIELERISKTGLWEKVDNLWEERFVIREHLGSVVSKIIKDMNDIGQIIAGDLYEQ